jgi:hypothetical protein
VRTSLLGVVTLALAAPASALGADAGVLLQAHVAVHCQVQQRTTGGGGNGDDAVLLGRFREYCNAPSGYQLVVRYAPGTLRGAILTAGEDEVVLNGSGEAILSRIAGPRIRERAITAKAGPTGFDTDRLTFELVPA